MTYKIKEHDNLFVLEVLDRNGSLIMRQIFTKLEVNIDSSNGLEKQRLLFPERKTKVTITLDGSI